MCFARKPAPLQLSWIGCEGTVGLEAIDGVLADRFLVAEGEERHYREKVLRLPDAYACYDPPAQAPPVAILPALASGRVTFGSFNNPSKINRQVLAVWGEILRRVPGSRLVLKYSGLGDPRARKRIEGLFVEAGGDPGRLELRDWSGYEEMLSQYGEIDLALDTFPFCGGATTCEALWMGVPVVTCLGQTWPSRRGTSLLSAVGQNASIASDLTDYIETAAQLAADLPRLAAIRSALRQRMADSPLCDGRRFARNLTEILRHLWRQWCNQERARFHPNPQDARGKPRR
jgi:predicted O-linked N-acetylglucosamine transferase (SPINDLY family)